MCTQRKSLVYGTALLSPISVINKLIKHCCSASLIKNFFSRSPLSQKLRGGGGSGIIKMLRRMYKNSFSPVRFQCALAALRLLVNFSMLLLFYFLSAAALIKHTNEEILLRQTFCSSFHCVSADDALIVFSLVVVRWLQLCMRRRRKLFAGLTLTTAPLLPAFLFLLVNCAVTWERMLYELGLNLRLLHWKYVKLV